MQVTARWTAVAIAGVVAGCAGSSPPPAAPVTNQAVAPTSDDPPYLSGTITTFPGGAPIPELTVVINPANRFTDAGDRPGRPDLSFVMWLRRLDVGIRDYARTVSGSDGVYQFGEIEAGTYDLVIYYREIAIHRPIEVGGPTIVNQSIEDGLKDPGTGSAVMSCTSDALSSCTRSDPLDHRRVFVK